MIATAAIIVAGSLVLCSTPAAHAEQAPAPSGATAPDKPAQIEHGRKMFIGAGCGWCHEGGGRTAGRCPQLMNDPHDDDFLISRIATGSPEKMPPYGQVLSVDDIQAIMAYIRDLKP
jgi:mono/diheme cytochrome c family protein